MAPSDPIAELQSLYPRIYMACHVDHVRASSSKERLSARDGTLLAHLSHESFTSPSDLAKHLKITPATLSEAIAHLEALGYVAVETDPEDERRRKLKLTGRGMKAMQNSSVLDAQKVGDLLGRLSSTEREKALEGMRLLARAAQDTT